MRTYEVKMSIRAECPDDATELIEYFTGKETHVEILEINECEDDGSEEGR